MVPNASMLKIRFEVEASCTVPPCTLPNDQLFDTIQPVMFLKNKVLIAGIAGVLVLLSLGYWEQMRNKELKTPNSEILIEPPLQEEQIANKGESPSGDTQQFVYPDDYVLRSDEMPTGFELEPLSLEAEKLGFTSNPGFFNNPELHNILYDEVNSSRIRSIYVAGYAKPADPSIELGIFAVQYTSKEDFDAELPKILATSLGVYKTMPIYLKHPDVLVIVWSDTAVYRDQMEKTAAAFEARLGLVRIAN